MEPGQMIQRGVIVEVATPAQARIAEKAGAYAVTALERMPAGILAHGGVARMTKQAVIIPAVANTRGNHFMEAICQHLCEALQCIRDGATVIRIGDVSETGTGDVLETIRQVRSIASDIRQLCNMNDDELRAYAESIATPFELVMQTKLLGRLPVTLFAAGATPSNAALMMHLGCDGIFVGSGIFKSYDPAKHLCNLVQAVTHYKDPCALANIFLKLTRISFRDAKL